MGPPARQHVDSRNSEQGEGSDSNAELRLPACRQLATPAYDNTKRSRNSSRQSDAEPHVNRGLCAPPCNEDSAVHHASGSAKRQDGEISSRICNLRIDRFGIFVSDNNDENGRAERINNVGEEAALHALVLFGASADGVPREVMKAKSKRASLWLARLREFYPGDDLLSHAVTHAVPLALEGLTSVFGMGTGVTPPV